jgi:diguanylate cyclase (GGDEF)-like protein
MKVLVVDRDPLFSRLLKLKLEKWGHSVTVEHDGEAAYELVAKEPYRMVILDYDLPGINGIELCERIRKIARPRSTYILFYADLNEKAAAMSCLEAGANDYLNKPLNTAELQLRIKAVKRLLNIEDMLLEGAGMDLSTGVANDASFREFFRVVMADSMRSKKEGALLYVRVTNYSTASKAHGFNPTESMMAGVATLLRNIARSSDLVGRISKDTLCIMLQLTNSDKCLPVVEKIAAQAPNIAVIVDHGTIAPEVEISASNYPQGDLNYAQILDRGQRTAYPHAALGGAAPAAAANDTVEATPPPG